MTDLVLLKMLILFSLSGERAKMFIFFWRIAYSLMFSLGSYGSSLEGEALLYFSSVFSGEVLISRRSILNFSLVLWA